MWYLKISDDKMNLVGKNGELYHGFREESVVLPTEGVALTLKANYYQGGYWILDKPKRLYNIYGDDKGTGYAGNVWDKDEISPTLETMQGGNKQLMVEVYPCLTPGRQKKRQNGPRFRGENEEMFTLTCQDIHGVAEKWLSQKGVDYICDPKRGMATDINPNVAQPLMAKGQQNWTGSFISPDIENLEKSTEIGGTEPTKINLKNGEQITSDQKDRMQGLRIRKLTPKECWRLMGWDDESFEKAEQVNSNSQLYKQAGNGIVVNCLAALIKQML